MSYITGIMKNSARSNFQGRSDFGERWYTISYIMPSVISINTAVLFSESTYNFAFCLMDLKHPKSELSLDKII